MSKKKKYYLCLTCGSGFSKWSGQCPDCQEWNSLVESEQPSSALKQEDLKVIPLSAIASSSLKRIKTNLEEFNLVCGGGIVPGAVILIGGEPGIGKSTLALQMAQYFKTLYISGEESSSQLRNRAERVCQEMENIKISSNMAVENIITLVKQESPECLVIDSIQMLYSVEIPGVVGSVSQLKESTVKLVKLAKKTDIPVLLIGHITKEGNIAGPKVLEHLVDTVLYFEGDYSKDFRILRSFKNRFGSINEVGLFQMSVHGLEEVKDKNKIFLNLFGSPAPGNAVAASLEGSRSILFEVQSLVNFTSFPNPRRMSDGFDLNRLILLIAVLEKHAGLKINNYDVFINISGGLRITETAADLAVAMAITSSLKNRPIPKGIGFLGEISLAGEIRPVSQVNRRVSEFKNSGFKKIFIPEANKREVSSAEFTGEIIGGENIKKAVDYLFG